MDKIAEVNNVNTEKQSEEFAADVELTAQAAIEIMSEFCPKVIRIVEDEREGEAIISYFKNGEQAFKILLDPFEVPIMKIAMEHGNLRDYILIKNGIMPEDIPALRKYAELD